MKEISFEECKKIEFDILCCVHNFCVENNLRYYLAFGTLIGAVRHKGFIPWDDDIDIFMPREDYEVFIRTFNCNGYACKSLLNKDYFLSFAKVYNIDTIKKEPVRYLSKNTMGLDIDVFPLDYYYDENFPDKIFKSWKLLKKLKGIAVSKYDKNAIKNAIRFFLHPFAHYFAKEIENLTFVRNKSDKAARGYISAYCISNEVRIYKNEWFENYILMEFENGKFRLPVGFDELLNCIYGDYMKLPPLEEQVTHHTYKAYWKN